MTVTITIYRNYQGYIAEVVNNNGYVLYRTKSQPAHLIAAKFAAWWCYDKNLPGVMQ